MKTYPCIRLLAMGGLAAIASCANQPISQRTPVSAAIHPKSSLSERIFQEVNSYRASRGAAALQRHPGLDRLAQEHCEYLRKHRGTFSLSGRNVSHFGFDSRSMAARERYQMANLSENVAAATHPSARMEKDLLELWKGSKEHHYNMVDDWQLTGIGVVVDSDGAVFSTQLFGNLGVGQMLTRERFAGF